MRNLLEITAVVTGTFFMFVASFGVLRLSDFYARIHPPTKAATLGLALLFAALALHLAELTSVMTKAVLALLFIGATAPVGAHILSRAAYRRGVRAPGVALDEYEPHAQHADGEASARDRVDEDR